VNPSNTFSTKSFRFWFRNVPRWQPGVIWQRISTGQSWRVWSIHRKIYTL